MVNLGQLGQTHEPVDTTFDYFGTTIRVNPDLTDVVLVDFLEQSALVDVGDKKKMGHKVREAMELTKSFVRACIHPDDFDLYWKTGLANRQDVRDHMLVADAIIASVGKDLSALSGGSSPGRTATADESEVDFLRRVTAGRPDLEVGLMDELANRRATG